MRLGALDLDLSSRWTSRFKMKFKRRFLALFAAGCRSSPRFLALSPAPPVGFCGSTQRFLALLWRSSLALSGALWWAFVGLHRAPDFCGLFVSSIPHVFDRRGLLPREGFGLFQIGMFWSEKVPIGKDFIFPNRSQRFGVRWSDREGFDPRYHIEYP